MEITKDFLERARTVSVLKQDKTLSISLIELPNGKQYILKQFEPILEQQARAEYLFLQTISAEHIIKPIGFLVIDKPNLVTEYLKGEPLSIHAFSNIQEAEICLADLCLTVASIHALGICLNDIKPDNIIVKNNAAYIIDLGLATMNLMFEREMRGTIAFAAPEKILRLTNHLAGDVFALGMLWFYLKHGKTIMDTVGEEEYLHLICDEELWQKQLSILETDELLLSLLTYSPLKRPSAQEVAAALSAKHNLNLQGLAESKVENYVFKTQLSAAEKLWKKRSLNCDYADEPQKLENQLSLLTEAEGRKLLVLDEITFITQPEEFFRSFPFGYRETNIYQPHFIEWLEEQPVSILLRRNKNLEPTSFFNEIAARTNAMQLWLGSESELKPVSLREIKEAFADIISNPKDNPMLKEQNQVLKPFQIRMQLLSLLKAAPQLQGKNELTEFLSWINISLPLALVEKVWRNWYVLVQEGLLTKQIVFEATQIRAERHERAGGKPSAAAIKKAVECAAKANLFNVAGEISFKTGDKDAALEYWSRYIEDLIKKEYFLSAFEFLRQLNKRIKTLPFELKKKEAFLARICGHFELSNSMYEDLIAQSDGLYKAVLSVDRAIVLQALKRFDEAIESYKTAIDLFRLHKDRKSLFRAMNNLGVVYFTLQRYSEAEQLFNDVLLEAKQSGNLQFEAVSYLNLGDLHLKRGEWKRVIYYAEKAISITYTNEKWNLYANGNVLKARALFAQGEFTDAIEILTALKANPQVTENLLQYQEILAWLLHFYLVTESASAEQLAESINLNPGSLHEILQRELFFLNMYEKRYWQASNYLHELAEMPILKAFFNSDYAVVKERMNEIKAKSELDTYLYYLTQCLRLFPEEALSLLAEEIQEAITLYSYKPIKTLSEAGNQTAGNPVFWADFIDVLSTQTEKEDIALAALRFATKLISVDNYVYFQSVNQTLQPLTAIDRQGNVIPVADLVLNPGLLDFLSRQSGFFYFYPVPANLEGKVYSDISGLGITTVFGYTETGSNGVLRLFYCDSRQNAQLDSKLQAACKTAFFLAQAAISNLENKEKSLEQTFDFTAEEAEREIPTMVGSGAKMREVYAKISLVSEHNVNVLITGPTGSGKELVAREIHRRYTLANQSGAKTPFIAVNCAAIPEQLLESELFGYKKGAFTGAVSDKKGKLLLADNGTIFLDEIGEMPLSLQAKLLRAIQEKVITPLGSDEDIPVNVRIIAATNQNLEELAERNLFRSDLYYRLKVMTIELPSLAERKEDIPLLAMAFLKKFNEKFNKQIKSIHPAVLNFLQNREWKGNVRELENEMERAVLVCTGDRLTLEDFAAEADTSSGSIYRNLPLKWQEFKEYKQRIEDELEHQYIKMLLEEAGDNITAAGKLGELDRMQVYRLLKKKKD